MDFDPPDGLCPLRFFRDNPQMEGRSFVLHRHWSQGILPEVGGLEDQAAWYGPFILATDTGMSAGKNRRAEIERRAAEREAAKNRGRKGRG